MLGSARGALSTVIMGLGVGGHSHFKDGETEAQVSGCPLQGHGETAGEDRQVCRGRRHLQKMCCLHTRGSQWLVATATADPTPFAPGCRSTRTAGRGDFSEKSETTC